MNNTVKYTTEYVYNNIKLCETRKIVQNTLQEYEQKYGANYHRIAKLYELLNF